MNNNRIKTVINILLASKEKYGALTAIVADGRRISYAELADDVMKLAASFQKMGLKGKKVELNTDLSVDWITVFLALVAAGTIVVLHEPELNAADYIDDLYMSVSAAELLRHTDLNASNLELAEADDTALFIFTSGTSGKPKIVMLSQKNLACDARLGAELIGKGALSPGDRTIPVLPLFHMFGITASLLSPLYVGLEINLISEQRRLIRELAQIRPQILFVVPMIVKTILMRALQLQKNGMSNELIHEQLFGGLRILVCGGAPLQPELVSKCKQFGVELLNGYGITECAPVVTTSSFENNVLGSVGRVNNLPGVLVRIINGTVHVSGDIVMKGYYKHDENPFEVIDGRLWFDTKDTGRIEHDGSLFIVGRKSNLIILDDGNNISPEEIEQLFDRFKDIKDVLVYPSEGVGGQIVTASILPQEQLAESLSDEELSNRISEMVNEINSKLPNYKQIRKWIVRKEDFHRTSLKKIIRTEVNYDA